MTKLIAMMLVTIFPLCGLAASTNEPPQLIAARKRYLQAISRLTEQYRIELKGLQQSATQRGDLDGALLYKAELDQVQEDLQAGSLSQEKPEAFSGRPIVTFNGHRYQHYNERVTRKDAERIAKEVGGHLASADSREELAFLVSMMRSSGYLNYWIASQMDDDATWIGKAGNLNHGPGKYDSLTFICEWDQ